MKAFWKFLNSPLIVAVLAALSLIVAMNVGLSSLLPDFDAAETERNKVEALGQLELISYSKVEATDKEKIKFVGEIRNHSDYIIRNITATVCFFNSKDELIDVYSEKIDGVGSVPPKGSGKFFIVLGDDRDYFKIPTDRKNNQPYTRTMITFVDLNATTPED